MKKIICGVALFADFILMINFLATTAGRGRFASDHSVGQLIIFFLLLISNLVFLCLNFAFLDSKLKNGSKFLSYIPWVGFFSVAVLFIFSIWELFVFKTHPAILIMISVIGIYNLMVSFFLK